MIKVNAKNHDVSTSPRSFSSASRIQNLLPLENERSERRDFLGLTFITKSIII